MFKPIKENMKNLSNLFHGQTQKLHMESNQNFNSEAKCYLVGPKIFLMVTYSILLRTGISLFPPFA